MRVGFHQQIIRKVIRTNQGNGVVPREAMHQSPCNCADHATQDQEGPDPGKDTHVAVLVALVSLGIARSSPKKLNSEETILDGGQIGVRLNQHNVLNVHAVRGLRPQAEDDETVDQRGDRKGQVVVFKPLGAEPEEENAGDG